MVRRRRYPSFKSVTVESAASYSVRTLIWIDMEPILELERSRCEKASRELDRANKKIEHFQNVLQPAYSQWFHSHFGSEVTQLRGLEAKREELEHLTLWVRRESRMSGCSERAAYERFERMRKGMEDPENGQRGRFDRGREDDSGSSNSHERSEQHSGEEDELPPDFDDVARMGFEIFFGDTSDLSPEEYTELFENFKQSFRDDFYGRRRSSSQGDSDGPEYNDESFERSSERSGRTQPDGNEARRKQIYRDLARKLHPDANQDLSLQEKELWHEVQAAYETKNLERLETLAAMAESGGTIGYSKIRSVSRLRAILKDFEKNLRVIKRTLKQTKKEPAWEFHQAASNSRQLKDLSRQINRELDDAESELSREVARLERQIERWKSPPVARKKRTAQERPPRPERPSPVVGMTKAEMDAYTGFGEPRSRPK